MLEQGGREEDMHDRAAMHVQQVCVRAAFNLYINAHSRRGSILRHMPILGGAQILFLANSAHQPSSPYPPYPRSFIKEVMRVSMLQHYRVPQLQKCIRTVFASTLKTML